MSFLLSLSLITIFYNWANLSEPLLSKRRSHPPTQVCTCVYMCTLVHKHTPRGTCFEHTHKHDNAITIFTSHTHTHIRLRYKWAFPCLLLSLSLSSSLPLVIYCSIQCSDIIVLCEQRLMVQCFCQGHVGENKAGVCCCISREGVM